jgi:hypothetical protein
MRPPARMKSGIASRGKLEAPEKRFKGTTLRDVVPFQKMKRIVVRVRAKPIGTLITVRRMIIPRMSHSTPCPLLSVVLRRRSIDASGAG